MEVIILGVNCVVTRKYVGLVKRRMKELKRYGVVIACTDPEVHDRYGVQDRCIPETCPGCGFLFPMNGKFLPALVVNGELVLHSQFPSVKEVNATIADAK